MFSQTCCNLLKHLADAHNARLCSFSAFWECMFLWIVANASQMKRLKHGFSSLSQPLIALPYEELMGRKQDKGGSSLLPNV